MILASIKSEQGIRIATIVVSLLLHLLLFVQLTNVAISSQAQAPHAATRISLNLLPFDRQMPEQVITDIPSPAPVLEPKAQSKPVLVKPKVKSEVKPESPVVPELATALQVAKQIQRGKSDNTAVISKQYLDQLLTYIEGHKYYPRLARGRGISGNIEVSFELLQNGEISDLKTIGASPVLRSAAEQTITSALPLPTPPKEIKIPLQVSYVMQFALN